jgi:hypothetical protein
MAKKGKEIMHQTEGVKVWVRSGFMLGLILQIGHC